MTAPNLHELAEALQRWLRPHMERSPDARAALRLLGQWLVEEADRADAGATDARAPGASPDGASPAQDALTPSPPAPPKAEPRAAKRGIVPLNIGGAVVHVEVEGETQDLGRARLAGGAVDRDESDGDSAHDAAPSEIDLALIERRSRLKAASCLLFIERREAKYDPEREKPLIDRMQAMIGEGKSLPGCFLWVFWREREQPEDDTLRAIEQCYLAHADAVALVRTAVDLAGDAPEHALGDAMMLLTEANSALRVALETTWLTTPDTDQDEAHHWLRRETKARSIYIPRFMRLDDPADPGRAGAVREEVAALREHVEAHAKGRARLAASFKRIRYHALKIQADAESHDPHDRQKIGEEAARLLAQGVAPSDRRFGDAIPRAAAQRLADGDDAALAEVAAYILHREAQRSEARDAQPAARRWSPRVDEAKALLRGGRVVIVGGEPYAEAIARTRDALGVEVEWVRLTEHGTGEPMRAPIQRDDTVCVLVLIKLCGHLHAEEATAYARAAGRACVLLPAGYNPEQIAEAVMQQASRQLQGERAGAEAV